MPENPFTPQTAPRDINALMQVTPFQLRIITQNLGGLTTDADKMAWHNMSTQQARAAHVLKLLSDWDKANPGAAGAAAAAVAMNGAAQPAQPTVNQPPQVAVQQVMPVPPTVASNGVVPSGFGGGFAGGPAAVDPSAVAAVGAATSDAKPARAPRQPRTSTSGGEATSPADTGPEAKYEVINLLNRILEATNKNNETATTALTKIVAVVEAAADSRQGRVTALEAKYTEIQNQVGAMYSMQRITLVAFLTFMQEKMNASMSDILGAAISDSQSFDKLFAQATAGKA
jgi:hypothetical protein